MDSLAATIASAVSRSGSKIAAQLGAVVGSGQPATDMRELPEFHAIEAKMAGDVEVEIGPGSQVAITSGDNIVPLLETTVEDGVLTITSKSPYSPKAGVRLQVVTPRLDRVALDGAGKLAVTGLDEPKFEAVLNGAGNVKADGRVGESVCILNGAGNLGLAGLWAGVVKVELNGAGNADVFAENEVDARLNGVGNITIHGSPAKSDLQRHGVGVIRRA